MNSILFYSVISILLVQTYCQSYEIEQNGSYNEYFFGNDSEVITAGPPPYDKPWVPAWGFFEGYNNSWKERHDALLKQTQINGHNIKVVFLGDSLTDNWSSIGKDVFDKYYSKFGAFNYGIGGDSTREILWRLAHKEMDGINPKLLVLMIGTNNLNGEHGWHPWVRGTDEEVAKAVKLIIDTLRIKLPNTKILVLGILPQGSENQNKRIRNINTLVSNYKDGQHVFNLDMWSHFIQSHEKLFAADTVHPTKEGYLVWAQTMEPMFEKLMKL